MTGGAERRPPRVPAVALALTVVLVFAVVTLTPSLGAYLEQQRQIAAAQAHVAAQRSDLARLAAADRQWADPAYVRAQAGSRLFFVLPGSTVYRVLHATAADAATTPPPATPQLDRPVWSDALLGSLVAAGETSR